MSRRGKQAAWFLAFGEIVLDGVTSALVGRKVSARMKLPPAEDAWEQVMTDLCAAIENRRPLDIATRIQ